jgi:hypothetical protein
VSISHSLSTRIESCPESDPLEEFKAASLEFLSNLGLEDDAQFFIEEETDYSEPKPLDEFAEPPRPPIELKLLPTDLRYAFLNDDPEFPMIISDKLTWEQTLRLMAVLATHSKILKELVLPCAPIAFLQIPLFYLLENHNVDSTMR